ncbi:MAG: BolA family transcriptional regulator [Caulobacteraceae bacterium]|nr:BolA family transcriptional regulator [Caulobacter sp.]
MANGETAAAITAKLTQAFAPTELTVEDESWKHAGHSGARPEGETHFAVAITSAAFAGLSRVERQRRIYAVLGEEMAPDRVHALQLSADAPGEG